MMERKAAVVALGMFDGMHIGHRELIRSSVTLATDMDAIASVYTFQNHPESVLSGESPKNLMDAESRGEVMRILGVQDLRMVPFTEELATLSPAAFIDLLEQIWQLRAVVVGYNYSFGQFGAGTPETLKALGEERGFTVVVVQPVLYNGEPVSSTRIRALIERGEVETAAHMLTAPYEISGTVVMNKQFGRTIDFPTANIEPSPHCVLPTDGVYATEARTEDGRFRAVTNLGMNPTVGGVRRTVETHLIDFSGDLYGQTLRVSFLKRIRGEIRFDCVEALREQIAQDVKTAKAQNI